MCGPLEHLLVAIGVAERQQRPPPDEALDADRLAGAVIDQRYARQLEQLRPAGCDVCTNTGYRDRVGAFELVRMSDSLRAVMTAGGSVDDLRAVATEEGTRTLMQEALHLVSQGITGLEEVNRTLYGSAT